MRDNPEGSELDLAVDDRRYCKKNSPSVLSYIDKRIKEGCDRDSEVGTFTAGEAGTIPTSFSLSKQHGGALVQSLPLDQ